MLSVFDSEFWAGRLRDAGEETRLSVFLCSIEEWDRINVSHQRILSEVVSGKVLDVGCGYGRYAPMFSDYTGVDLSDALIKKANELYPSKTFVKANIEKGLPFKDKEFDWGFSVSLRGMIIREGGQERWDAMEKEILRVCKHYISLEYTNYNDRYIK